MSVIKHATVLFPTLCKTPPAALTAIDENLSVFFMRIIPDRLRTAPARL
ncbi:MAG: hypothetical protein SPC85_00010 [Eubacteriales bacterium]|nr:hypothetical protein [Eubacteriales bacterium]